MGKPKLDPKYAPDWTYRGSTTIPTEEEIESYWGFLYRISNPKIGYVYIGQKCFHPTCSCKDWRTYCGSSDLLDFLMKNRPEGWNKDILQLFKTREELDVAENRLIFSTFKEREGKGIINKAVYLEGENNHTLLVDLIVENGVVTKKPVEERLETKRAHVEELVNKGFSREEARHKVFYPSLKVNADGGYVSRVDIRDYIQPTSNQQEQEIKNQTKPPRKGRKNRKKGWKKRK